MQGYTVGEFASEGRVQGKITFTTHHSSKESHFGAVIIRELVEEVFPAAPWVAEAPET